MDRDFYQILTEFYQDMTTELRMLIWNMNHQSSQQVLCYSWHVYVTFSMQ